jgi:hypothetical protein
VRELGAPWESAVMAGNDEWVEISGHVDGQDEGSTFIHAGQRLPERAKGVRLVWVSRGQLVGQAHIEEAVFKDGNWILGESHGVRFEPLRPVTPSLPDPELWQEASIGISSRTPWLSLWRAPPSPGRTAWLLERAVTLLGTVLLGGLALPLVCWNRRWGLLAVLSTAVVWRVVIGGALSAMARGVWPWWFGSVLPVAVLAGAYLFSLWIAHRRI